MYVLETCQREVFSTAYSLRRTTQGAHYFVPQSMIENIIVNMIDNGNGPWNIVVWVTSPWEVESKKERGAVLVV